MQTDLWREGGGGVGAPPPPPSPHHLKAACGYTQKGVNDKGVGVMAKCPAITGKGEPCKGYVHPGHTYCPAHDPARDEARKRSASKAGRSRAGSELHTLKQKLIQLGDDVMDGSAHRGDAAVAAQCYGVAIKAVEAEVKVRELQEARLIETQLKIEEQRELVARLEALEEVLDERKQGTGGYYSAR